MKKKFKYRILSVLRAFPLIACLVLILIYLFNKDSITIETITSIVPSDYIPAIGFMMLLYAVKSLTVFFPIVVLNIVGGFIFPPVTALVVNSAGVVIELCIPYFIGRASGKNMISRLEANHPQISKVIHLGGEHHLFKSFFLRVIAILPGDAISMYFGAMKMPFARYMLGSFLGILPILITSTLLGTSITTPNSPMFWVSVVLTVVIAAVSILGYALIARFKKKHRTK